MSAASPLRRLLGSFLGSGMIPGAPGTWGSLATVVVVVLVLGMAGGPLPMDWDGLLGAERDVDMVLLVTCLVIVVVTLGGAALGDRASVDWGLGDPGPFVLDEVAGQLIALLPLLPGPLDPLGVVTAFVLFRLFDVTKPPPIRQLERLPGGVGIMADDLAAGLAAAVPVALLF